MAASTLEERRFYVYVIFRPNGAPCYVGKGQGGRWSKHVRNAYNPHLAAIYAKAHGDLPIVKVRDNLTEAEAFKIEIALISAIGREEGQGPLVNLTDGGEGKTGCFPSPATKLKMRISHRGKVRAPEHSLALSKSLRGRAPSSKTRAAVSAAKKGVPQSEEARAKISAALRGRSKSEAHRKAAAVNAANGPIAFWSLAALRGETIRWWRTPSGETYRAAKARSELDMLGRKPK